MDLALELGFPTVAALNRSMTEAEFRQWQDYDRRRMLPSRRLELLLANIARLSSTMTEVESFIIDPKLRERLSPKTVTTADEAAEVISLFSGMEVKFSQSRKPHGR